MSKKVHAIVARSIFPSQNVKKQHAIGPLLDVPMSFCVAGAKGLCTLSKRWVRREGFAAVSKTLVGAKRICNRGISCGTRSIRDMSIRDVRRSGSRFPENGFILEHQIFRFATMILRDGCSTSYDLASLCRGRRSTLHRCRKKSQNALVRGRHLSTPLSIWEEVSQNCFVFWCCQLRKLRMPRRIASFLML